MNAQRDFQKLKRFCESQSALSNRVIDELLIYLVAEQSGLDGEFDRQVERYGPAAARLQGPNLNLLKTQYIGQRIFRKGGLLERYLQHPALARLQVAERQFLEHQLTHPWRLCFAEIQERHPGNFFTMWDVFGQESFLLYSPGMGETLKTQTVWTWNLLVQDNGSCCQCFGPIVPFRSFTDDDLFYFAQQYEPAIQSEADLVEDLNEHPLAYMMLMAYCEFPVIVTRGFEMVFNKAVWEDVSLEGWKRPSGLQRQEKNGIELMELPDIGSFPHYAKAYYDRSGRLLTLTAMTDEGFKGLCDLFADAGLHVIPYPDVRLHNSMVIAIQDILGRSPSIYYPYGQLFEPETPADDNQKKAVAELKELMNYLNRAWNAGQRDFSVDELARRFQLDPRTVDSVLEVFRKLPLRP